MFEYDGVRQGKMKESGGMSSFQAQNSAARLKKKDGMSTLWEAELLKG